MVEGQVPPGWTSRRPNDQRMFNFLIRWRYDVTLAQLGRRADFRVPQNDTKPEHVLSALAITCRWMNDHPGCGVAAWLMSGVTVEEDYAKAGLQHLVVEAKAAMHDAEFKEVTAEYTRAGGLWDTKTVFLVDQLCERLKKSKDKENVADVEKVVGQLPWLQTASSEARSKWIAAANQKMAEQKEDQDKKEEAHPMATKDAQKRRKEIADITDRAAKKIHDETEAKRAKLDQAAKARHEQLVQMAGVEYLRKAYGGKKSTPMSDTLAQKLSKACKCVKVMAAGLHKASTHCA